MYFLYAIFIALANNLDNISVRIAYSIRGIRISTLKNLWISFITFTISSVAAFSGTAISNLFNKRVSSYISMILLVGIGLWFIYGQCKKKEEKQEKIIENKNNKRQGIFKILKRPEDADMDNSKDIDFKEATFLGIALSIDNIGGGLSAGMIGLNGFFQGFVSAVVSFLALWIGNYITIFLNKYKLGDKAIIIAGIALIALGLKQIF